MEKEKIDCRLLTIARGLVGLGSRAGRGLRPGSAGQAPKSRELIENSDRARPDPLGTEWGSAYLRSALPTEKNGQDRPEPVGFWWKWGAG